MKSFRTLYRTWLWLYPPAYRRAFGAEMLQTFVDDCDDTRRTDGALGAGFWIAALTDELSNLARQHRDSIRETDGSPARTAGRLVLVALLLPATFVVSWASLVRLILAQPHPHVQGIGALAALAALVLAAGTLSLIASAIVAHAALAVFPARLSRLVRAS
jgi:hypothetical protein